MKCLHRLFDHIDKNRFPGICKEFVITVYKRKGKLTLDPILLQTGSDSGPLLQIGIIEQNMDNKVDFTDSARAMID
jgi:hypothetical protein